MNKPSQKPIIPGTKLAFASILCMGCLPTYPHDDATSTKGSDTSTGSDGSTTANDVTEGADMGGGSSTATSGADDCIPPLDTLIDVQLRRCSSVACDAIDLDIWPPPANETGTLVATCTVVGAPIVFEPSSKKRWILESCTGDAIPDDGRLALDWETDPVVDPSLPTNTLLSIELRRPRYTTHALSIRDASDELVVLEISNFEPPSAEFSTPVTIEIAETLCEVPPVSCLGPQLIHELHIDDGAGNEVQLGWGASTMLGENPRYHILVRRALSFPDVPCGEFSQSGYFDLVIAR